MRFKLTAFFKLYKIRTLLHRRNVKVFAKNWFAKLLTSSMLETAYSHFYEESGPIPHVRSKHLTYVRFKRRPAASAFLLFEKIE